MKCPYCKEEIISDLCFLFDKKDNDYTSGRQIYKCNKCGLFGIKELWQELTKTKQALDVAQKAMLEVHYQAPSIKVADKILTEALDQIKQITEQKEPMFAHNKIEFPEFNDNLLEEFDKQFFENGQDDDLTETALEQKDAK